MRGHRASLLTRQWVIVGVSIASTACAVDDRQLVSARLTANLGGAGGAGGAGGCSNGASQDCSSFDGDDSGTTGDASVIAATCGSGICPDLNNNNLPDNTETLASNSTFDSDSDGWDAEPGVGLGWNVTDACDRCESGSVSVTNEFAGTSGPYSVDGARQCINAKPGQHYVIVGAADPSADSLGGVGLAFYASADCSGDAITSGNSSLAIPEWAWQKVTTHLAAPDSAQSVALRLVVAAPTLPPAGIYANVLIR